MESVQNEGRYGQNLGRPPVKRTAALGIEAWKGLMKINHNVQCCTRVAGYKASKVGGGVRLSAKGKKKAMEM